MAGIKGIQLRHPSRIIRGNTKVREDNRDIWLEQYLDGLLSPGITNLGGSFHPSSLGNPCDRFLYLHYQGLLPGQEISSKLRRIFDHGNSTQSRYENYFNQLEFFVSREIPAVIDGPPIHGRADILLKIPEYGDYIVEVKTINDRGFGELRNAKEEHRIQLQIYLNILDIEKGGILYEDKNNQEIKIFGQRRDLVLWKGIIDRCNRIMKMEKLPSLESVEYVHDAKYCPCLGVADA